MTSTLECPPMSLAAPLIDADDMKDNQILNLLPESRCKDEDGIWPIDAARRTALTMVSSKSVEQLNSKSCSSHGDEGKSEDPFACYDYSDCETETNGYSLRLSYSSTRNEILVFSDKTNEIVDRINPEDVIGCDLEILFLNDGPEGFCNNIFPKAHTGDSGDNYEERDVGVNDEGLAAKLAALSNEDAKGRGVGKYNDRAKKRVQQNEIAEEHTRRMLSLKSLEEERAARLELEMGSTRNESKLDSDESTRSSEDDDNVTDHTPAIFDCQNLSSPALFCNGDGKKGDHDNHATAFLNIYVYPRENPSPNLFDRMFQCFGQNNADNSSHTSGSQMNENEFDISKFSHRRACHRKFRLKPCEDFASARSIVRAIRSISKLGQYDKTLSKYDEKSNNSTPKVPIQKYLVMINPFSGRRDAMETYYSAVAPMLEQCGVEHNVFITKYAGHARYYMKQTSGDFENDNIQDVSKYDAIVAMGGDGILFEIMQGLRQRDDFDALMERLNFGIVGCGTSNGLAASLLHCAKEKYGAMESIFRICKGHHIKLDLSSYMTKEQNYLSFLTFSWGLIADIDIESECLRFLGILRNDVWGAWRVFNLRLYRAKFSYLPTDACQGSTNEQNIMPPIDAPVPSSWVTIEDEFILFWACHVTHAASNVLQSPDTKPGEGFFRIMVIRKNCSRLNLIQILLTMENGSHVKNDNVEFYNCISYRLDPISSGSFNNLDGEVVDAGTIQGRVHKNAMNFFC